MRVASSLLAVLTLWWAPAAVAQDLPKVMVAISGWTGFAPLSLAEKAGHLQEERRRRHIKFISQKDRHLAIASGDVPCAATTVETWSVWNANGVATKQVVQLDKSSGADGMVVRKESRRSPTSRARPSRRPRRGQTRISRWRGSSRRTGSR